MGEQTDDLEWVTLVSNDGYEFVIHKSAALVSGMIRKSLDPKANYQELQRGIITFDNINGVVLEKVCEYLYYNQKHAESKDVPDLEIPPELCLELLIAANYLDV